MLPVTVHETDMSFHDKYIAKLYVDIVIWNILLVLYF